MWNDETRKGSLYVKYSYRSGCERREYWIILYKSQRGEGKNFNALLWNKLLMRPSYFLPCSNG